MIEKNNLCISLFSSDAIEINNIHCISDRIQMKLRLFLRNFVNTEVEFGKDSIIFLCMEKANIGEYAERIVDFFDNLNVDYYIEETLKDLVNKVKNLRETSVANIEYLKRIKNNKVNEDEEYLTFKEKINNLLVITLKEYQYKSAYLLTNAKSGFDFSVPGSGKTIIAYATYAYLRFLGLVDNILIIGPKNAYNAWYDEYITCFGEKPDFKNLSEENIKDSKNYFSSSTHNHREVTFINTDKIRSLDKEMANFMDSSKCMLIIDEGHKVKNPDASSTKAAMYLSKHSNYKIILTGTPMPNGYEDLYSLTYIINPYNNIIPYNYTQLRKFTVKGIREIDEKRIMESLFPYYSRISKKQLIKNGELLPPKFHIRFTEMDEDQRKVYDFIDGLIANYHNKWEFEFERILMKAILIRKMQVSSNPKLLRKSIISSFEELRGSLIFDDDNEVITNEMIEDFKRKLAIADGIINKDINNSEIGQIIKSYINDEKLVNKNIAAVSLTKKLVDANKKVILWDTFVENMDTLKSMLENIYDIKCGIINGTVTGEDRQNTIDNFRYNDLMVLIASPATLAESISLHRCCQFAIYVNRNFNAAQFIQSKDRIHRINMPEGLTANYCFLLNKDSIDEGISERLELKESRMLRILDAENIQIGAIENQDNSIMSDEDVLATYKL